MYFLLILVFVIILHYLMVIYLRNEDYSSNNLNDNDNDFNSIDPTELKIKSNTFIDTGLIPLIFSSNNNLPIARVPLRPFKAPMLKYIFIDSFPAFFRYKTEFLQSHTDQGVCGSCWVFSVTSVLSDKLSLYSKGKIKKRLSVQQLLSCYPNNKQGCMGDSPEDLALWIDKNKIEVKYENDYPYDQNSSVIIQTDCPSQYSGVKVKAQSVRSITTFVEENVEAIRKNQEIIKENIKRMKYELITKGPIYSAISVREDFYKYEGDTVYISTSQKASGGHSIEIIGYCEKGIDKRGINVYDNGYWICKNYWSNWPSKTKNGIFALKMGVNNCGIESRCGTLEPQYSNQIVPQETFYKTPENFHNYVRFSF